MILQNLDRGKNFRAQSTNKSKGVKAEIDTVHRYDNKETFQIWKEGCGGSIKEENIEGKIIHSMRKFRETNFTLL